MIKAVLFDVGGTLLQPKPSVGAIYADVAAKYGVQESPVLLQQKFKSAFKDQTFKGKKINKDWWREVVESILNRHQFKNFDAFFDDLYESFADPARWQVFDDVLPAFETLVRDGVKIGVASNWDERLEILLKRLHLHPFLDWQFISYQMGVQKPDPEFYRRCLEKMNLPPESIMFVGDDPTNDSEAPQKAGMKTLLLDRNNSKPTWPKISTLRDLFNGF